MTFRILKQAVMGTQVPVAVFDNLYSAKENDLKVILYVLNKEEIDVADIATSLSISVSAVHSSLFFWADKGLIMVGDTQEEKPAKKRLSSREVLAISNTRPEINVLVTHLQKIYGHALNHNATEAYINLYIENGVPVEVILILAAYFGPVQKGPVYTRKVIANLFEKEGVKDVDKAEEHITLLNTRNRRYTKVCEIFVLEPAKLTKSEKTIIDKWYEIFNMSEDMIRNAYLVRGLNASIKYCNGILKSWSQKGYRRPEDINEISNGFRGPEGRTIDEKDDIMLSGMYIIPDFDAED